MKNTAFTTSPILTEGEAEALKAVMKAEEVNLPVRFTSHGANFMLRNLSINDTYTLIGCIAVHLMQLEEELEDNRHFETEGMLNTLIMVKSKLTRLVNETAEQNTQRHDMN